MSDQKIEAKTRESFASRFGLLMTLIGVSVGLGNVWRFPYMAGRFGGAAFVVFYLFVVVIIGIPALMAEYSLGRYTQRGTFGAFAKAGFPGGKGVGVWFWLVTTFAVGYYCNVIGWVLWYAVTELLSAFGAVINAGIILPPDAGFNGTSFLLQLLFTAIVMFSCALVLVRGLKAGIEKSSRWIMPAFFILFLILIIRAVTLPGAGKGIAWYIGGFRFSELKGYAMAASLGQVIFSLSLGGTFMVVYGSYLNRQTPLPRTAVINGIGDTVAALMAGFAIFPAVFAFGIEPSSGPGLIFFTLPKVFDSMPAGWLFAIFFYMALFGAAFLSAIAAFEVMIAGITDNTRLDRKQATWVMVAIGFVLAIPPMINFKVFTPWDLFWGSGMQTLGSVLAVIAMVWVVKRSEGLLTLAEGTGKKFPLFLYWWMRVVVPLAILFVGIHWLLESVFHINIFGG
jgi:NSS family neurotransmitter:Na+ symporter